MISSSFSFLCFCFSSYSNPCFRPRKDSSSFILLAIWNSVTNSCKTQAVDSKTWEEKKGGKYLQHFMLKKLCTWKKIYLSESSTEILPWKAGLFQTSFASVLKFWRKSEISDFARPFRRVFVLGKLFFRSSFPPIAPQKKIRLRGGIFFHTQKTSIDTQTFFQPFPQFKQNTKREQKN